MNSGMLPAKALIPAWTEIRITAAGPLLNSTGFPFKRCCTCAALSLQEKAYKINFYFPFAGGNCIFQGNYSNISVCAEVVELVDTHV